MDFVVNKVMDIDRDAENYRKKIEELIGDKQRELEKRINYMNLQWEEEGKSIKKTILLTTLNYAEKKAEEIKKEKEEQISVIEEKFFNNKSKIVDEVFSKIIHSL
ncbi:hypothetical protein KQI89_02925 [Clostridium sp. MSJ-4]|uniref:Uncharacterized protein n=1 Tax=Clostridium simiarum TaxID=2841506 RepID=A0ABS6EWU9_9CLOT|nr:hypothetical protein [Clostridium simiarum]MBU5590704.1 hypothetical protein [Clostridium simiarum]